MNRCFVTSYDIPTTIIVVAIIVTCKLVPLFLSSKCSRSKKARVDAGVRVLQLLH